jgi:hypothetical protein
MSAENDLMHDADACESYVSVGGSEDRAGVGPGADIRIEGGGDRPDHPPARDYFTDPAPLLGDRESREREEREERLERARPRRRAPRVPMGLVLVPLVVLAAGGLLILGRPEHHGSGVGKRSTAVRPAVREAPVRSGPAAAIGPARAIAVAPVRRHPRQAGHHSHHDRQAKPAEAGTEETSAPVESAAPEVIATESDAETSSGSEPAQSTSTPAEESSGSNTSSSTETNRQFGFGR